MEDRRSHAKDEHRDEYSKKLKGAIMELEIAGQSLGALTCAKKMAVEEKNFEEAKVKAAEIEELRNEIYRAHNVADLLELKGQVAKNDEKVTNSCIGHMASDRDVSSISGNKLTCMHGNFAV